MICAPNSCLVTGAKRAKTFICAPKGTNLRRAPCIVLQPERPSRTKPALPAAKPITGAPDLHNCHLLRLSYLSGYKPRPRFVEGEGGACPTVANKGVSPLVKLHEFLVFTLCYLHPVILQNLQCHFSVNTSSMF